MQSGQQVSKKGRAIGSALFFWSGILIAAEFLVVQPPARTMRGPFFQYLGQLVLLPGDTVAHLLGSWLAEPLTEWPYRLIVFVAAFIFWVTLTTYILYRRNWRGWMGGDDPSA